MIRAFTLTMLVFLLTAAVTRAESSPGLASNGLCGLATVASPVCDRLLSVAANASYGYTESLGPVDGAHHRLGGSLGIGVVPLPWLALALRFDGRFDLHPEDARGDDSTGAGDPRVFLRAGHALRRDLSLGGEAVIWLPGADAPSFEPKATTVDLKALLAYRLTRIPLSLLGNVGMRLDQSAASAPDLTRLRPGDRISLGLSDSHALLIALGASGSLPGGTELFGELALDLLVGDDAPSFSGSPLRATLGARKPIIPTLIAELSATVSTQSRPSIDPLAALVPIEPRFLIGVGLRYAFDLDPPKVEPPPPPVVAEPELPKTATVTGTLLDDRSAPLPDVRVVLRRGDEARETITDAEGRYSFSDVPVGPAILESEATGFALDRWELDVRPNMEQVAPRALTAKGNIGTLRLLTRTFTSEPLAAAILVRDRRGKKVASGSADAQGLYELDLPPGDYVVAISAPGYRPHRREVRIERYGVAILNVDMRAER